RAEQGIELIGRHADQLEQVGRNLKVIINDMKPTDLQTAMGLAITFDKASGHNTLLDRGEKVTAKNGAKEAKDLLTLSNKAQKIAKARAMQIADSIQDAGTHAHVVILDHHTLARSEADVLKQLPERVADAKKLLDFVTRAGVWPDTKITSTEARRDSNFLGDFGAKLGDVGKHVVTYNEKLLDREAALLRDDDIENSHAAKFARGAALIDQSHKNAEAGSPNYRKRIAGRTPISALASDHTHDENGVQRLDGNGKPVAYKPREDGSTQTR
ncbi:MAG: hypothetical protein K2Q01_04475, partial [Rickettsiales bacterium]|nr:hypothetical protein [Rickettsiales bacterium]